MRRTLLTLAGLMAGVCLALFVAFPAGAQTYEPTYGGGGGGGPVGGGGGGGPVGGGGGGGPVGGGGGGGPVGGGGGGGPVGGGGGGDPVVPPRPTPPVPPAGCPVVDPATQDLPPCHPRARASVPERAVTPGQRISLSTAPLFNPNSEVTIEMVRVNENNFPFDVATAIANASGGLDEQITIPGVPRGIYFIYVIGHDGEQEIITLTPIVVRPDGTATVQGASVQAPSTQGDSTQGDSAQDDSDQVDSVQAASIRSVPFAVAEVQQDLSPDAEAAVVDAVARGDAGLLLSPAGVLEVHTAQGSQPASQLATTGSDLSAQVAAGSAPVAAGSALVLAGTGMVLLRRRRSVLS